jgi:hypothetical protein
VALTCNRCPSSSTTICLATSRTTSIVRERERERRERERQDEKRVMGENRIERRKKGQKWRREKASKKKRRKRREKIKKNTAESHRLFSLGIGRSGRFGRKGVAINFVTAEDVRLLRELEQFYNTTIEEMPAHVADLI